MKRLQQPLSDVLSRTTSVTGLSGTDWKKLSDIIKVLEPLNEATKIACGSKYPTISMIEPILRGVEEAFENLAFDDETSVGLNNIDSEDSDDDDNSDDVQMGLPTIDNESQMPMGYNFSKNIIRNLKIRFCEIEEDKLYRKCTFLDPRYQDYFLTDDKVKDDIKKDIKEEIIAYKYSNNVFENEHETVAEPPVIKPTKFWDFMKQRRANREETVTLRLEKDIDQELIQYLYSADIDPWDDPIHWWKKESVKYPLLSMLARRYLPIPSTSLESERLFSTAGDIVTEKRNSLSPDNVARLLF
ncbi:E3 SUMO-protein ligase ZBED1-like [Anastrepha obliqua]|uniref:E3 SUMO-protein ligase ZBED1-like n=1 Tax=Anastrepha obliqua TaxID=95512 RepID=UPI002409AF8D|nr:E3 SUMO-protein ligase ZBED1-like [Anastrepha obliqua]